MSLQAPSDLHRGDLPDGAPCPARVDPTTRGDPTASSACNAPGAGDSSAALNRRDRCGGDRSGDGGDSAAAPFSQRVRQSFGRGAPQYEREALLQQAMAWRLARLCADLPLPEGPRADLGAGTGLLSRALQCHHRQLSQRPPLQLDLCPELLRRNPLASGPGHHLGPEHHCATEQHPSPGPLPADAPVRANNEPLGRLWDLNDGLPEVLRNASLLASSFALQWLNEPTRTLGLWCRGLASGGWLVLAVPTAGSFPQWHRAAARANVPCTALPLPDAEGLLQAAEASGLSLRHAQRLRFTRQHQGGLPTLRHLQRLGAGASRRSPLTPVQLRRLLAHWPATCPLTWEVLLLIGQRRP
jgi:malonyl-CoA O-methyltransferase